MHPSTIALLSVLCALCIAAWAQVWLALKIRAAITVVAALPQHALPTPAPKLSMIVPAKDEGETIEQALESKLQCGYPELEVIVVNDRSTDGTADAIARVCAKHTNLLATKVDQLPDGWLGKLHALHRGLALAKGEWVLLSDADVYIERGTLGSLIAYAESEKVDAVAVFPAMKPVSLAIDACLAGMLRTLAISAQIWKANTDSSPRGVGVGAFILVRREWLIKTDAISVLRMEIADDVALGALLRQSGAKTRFFAGQSAVHLTFQPSLSAVASSANKGGGMFGWSAWLPIVVALIPLVLEIVIPCIGVGSSQWIVRAVALVALLGTTLTHVLLSMHFHGPVRGATLWPIGHVITSITLLRAGYYAWKHQGIFWRNTFYSRQVIDAGRRLDMKTLKISVRAPAPVPVPTDIVS